jgi:release factor glutamine methyltransferase
LTGPDPHASALVARLRRSGVVFAEQELELLAASSSDPALLESRVDRRVAGEPLEVVLGWAAFDGLRVPVSSGVFVPRRRSEALVEVAETRRPRRGTPADPLVVVDLCCGTGALGVALARRLTARGEPVRLVLADVDRWAVAAARRTLVELAVPGTVHWGDLYRALPDELRGRTDVVLANAPYVPSPELALMPREARDHEPRRALDGGVDGLDVVRGVAAGARDWLAAGGIALSEVAPHQSPAAVRAWAAAGLSSRVERDTVLLGVWS